MLPSALIIFWTPTSYYSGFHIATVSAVRLQLSLIVRKHLPSIDIMSTLLFLIWCRYVFDCYIFVGQAEIGM